MAQNVVLTVIEKKKTMLFLTLDKEQQSLYLCPGDRRKEPCWVFAAGEGLGPMPATKRKGGDLQPQRRAVAGGEGGAGGGAFLRKHPASRGGGRV